MAARSSGALGVIVIFAHASFNKDEERRSAERSPTAGAFSNHVPAMLRDRRDYFGIAKTVSEPPSSV
jgi:hypothetical protein